MTLRLWPRSLAARTAVVLLVGLVVVQVAGLTIHALDRIDVQRLAQARDVAVRVVSTYRTVMMTAPERRDAVLGDLRRVPGPHRRTRARTRRPRICRMTLPFGQRLLRVNLNLVPLMGVPHWRELRIADRTGPASCSSSACACRTATG